jgi:hypothetical protein
MVYIHYMGVKDALPYVLILIASSAFIVVQQM